MYISQIELKADAARRPEFWRTVSGGVEAHKLIWGLFADSPDRRRDFLCRRRDDGRGPKVTFLTVSARAPLDRSGLWEIRGPKAYQPRLKTGRRLGFSLRANPVISRRDHAGRLHRHDVIMDAKKRLAAEGRSRPEWPPLPDLVQEAGFRWLSRRAGDNGFAVKPNEVGADGYHQVRFAKGARQVSLSSLDFYGVLTVIDPEAFGRVLYQGLGPAKGYGFGLLLVRPLPMKDRLSILFVEKGRLDVLGVPRGRGDEPVSALRVV
ncbi:MAG: type I-E CRISPR-associated protein Cas6/Cse3/CasE, partial [Proteobacteria bacterium]|nr:type I-E CRISPR-associated protein Cas6/Cse3/CasE [Pseudomonadota bacterium]